MHNSRKRWERGIICARLPRFVPHDAGITGLDTPSGRETRDIKYLLMPLRTLH